MLTALFRLAALLPLPVLHALGVALGWTVYALSPTYRRRIRDNLAAAGLGEGALLRRAVAEAGKMMAELPFMWLRPDNDLMAKVVSVAGWDQVLAARAEGRGIVFLTPHLGCWEITAPYAAMHMPLTILYRPPRIAALEPMMRAGRVRGGIRLATTDLSGVRALLKALKAGEPVGILPDQVPGQGEGVWAPFLGRPAYTITLTARLARSSGAALIMACGERLPGGRGYALGFRRLPPLPADPAEAAAAVNRHVEEEVRRLPAQYLWGYNRHKVPAGAPGPEAAP